MTCVGVKCLTRHCSDKINFLFLRQAQPRCALLAWEGREGGFVIIRYTTFKNLARTLKTIYYNKESPSENSDTPSEGISKNRNVAATINRTDQRVIENLT